MGWKIRKGFIFFALFANLVYASALPPFFHLSSNKSVFSIGRNPISEEPFFPHQHNTKWKNSTESDVSTNLLRFHYPLGNCCTTYEPYCDDLSLGGRRKITIIIWVSLSSSFISAIVFEFWNWNREDQHVIIGLGLFDHLAARVSVGLEGNGHIFWKWINKYQEETFWVS